MVRSSASRRSKRQGIAAVEAAIVLPLLVTFVIAIVDIGRLAKVSNALTNGARNGAQYGSASAAAAASSSKIRSAAVTEMAYLPNVNGTNPTVSATTVAHAGSQFIKVTMTYDMTGTSIFNVFSINSMTRTVEMQMMPE